MEGFGLAICSRSAYRSQNSAIGTRQPSDPIRPDRKTANSRRSTFQGIAPGDDEAIYQRLRIAHPSYNGSVYEQVLFTCSQGFFLRSNAMLGIALCADTRSRLERLRPLQAALQGRPIPWRKAQGTSVKSWGQNHRCSLSEACLDCPIATAGLRLFRGPWPVALVGHRSCGLTINFFKSSAPQACFLAKLAQLSHTLAARHRIETRSSRLPVAGIQR
ncbi:hypothetical protein ACVINH_002959 [Rhizobium anhuiense]